MIKSRRTNTEESPPPYPPRPSSTIPKAFHKLERPKSTIPNDIERIIRPKSTIAKKNTSTLTSRPAAKKINIRSVSINKDYAYKPFPVFSEDREVIGLTFDELHRIYLAKCKDLNISSSLDQEKRFLDYCWLHFKDRRFNMSESGIGVYSARVIGKILKNNSNFAYIDVSKNLIKDEGAVELVNCVKKAFNTVHLDVSSNDITPEGAKAILKMIEHNQSIISLNISSHEGLHRNRLSEEGGESLSKILASNQILTYLDVSGTCLGADGLEHMLKGLENNVTLTALNLANNSLGSKIIEKFANVIVSTDIRDLNISMNRIGNEGCEYLALMLSGDYHGYCTITKLDLSDNEITTKGLSTLLVSMRISTQLVSVNLRKNRFNKGLSSNFCEFLTDNNSIKHLDFSHCEIKCEGLGNIGEGLTKNKTLKSLNLSGNSIKDRGIEMIAYGLSKNKVLKHLDLNSNEIKNKGAILLAKVIKANTGLESLHLKDNSIKDSGGQSLYDSIRYNQKLQKLTLELNPMNFRFITEIKDRLKVNEDLKKKSLIPSLNESIHKSHIDGDIEKIFAKIKQKVKEKQEAENRLKVQGEKLESMKKSETEKLDEVKAEYSEIKVKSYKLSTEIDDLLSHIYRVRLHGEKQISEMSGKVGVIVNQSKELEKKRAALKDICRGKREDRQRCLKIYEDELLEVQKSKTFTEGKLMIIKSSLEEKRKQISVYSKSAQSFLASEKLASTKKQFSPSPQKSNRSSDRKRRAKSFSQKS